MPKQKYIQQLKTNMAKPEPSGRITGRPEHANTDEAEEHDLKNSFMKITDALQGERKIPWKK